MWISLGSLIVGVIATVLVSRYYFRRSFEKSLTPYVQFSSSPFRRVDPAVKAELDIRYKGEAIDHLFEIQFLVANTGEKAIRDLVEPLSVSIPGKSSLLDATLLHVSPSGRKVNLAIASNRNKVTFDIPLLNRREFFIFKLLLNGEPKISDFIFNIAADELPPELKAEPLPPDAVGTAVDRMKFEPWLLLLGIAFLGMGIGVATLIFDRFSRLPAFDVHLPLIFFTRLNWGDWASVLSIVPAVFFLLAGVFLTLGSMIQGSFPRPKQKFIVPNDRQLLRLATPFSPRIVTEHEWED